MARHLGFEPTLDNVGQVYPRSLDLDVVSRARAGRRRARPAWPPRIRLMAGQELVTEGFQPGQVGSSAMPHKMNTRSCERINGFDVVLARPPHDGRRRWPATSGTRATCRCSVVRRVALPDAFFATDGLFETFLTVLDEFGAYPAVIERELRRYLPFLATTKVLMAAVRAGVGREAAHEAIKEHAVAVALDDAGEGRRGQRPARPAGRRRRGCGLDRADARRRRSPTRSTFVGAAPRQVGGVRRPGRRRRGRADPDAAAYRPGADPLTPSHRTAQVSAVTELSLPHLYSGKVRDIYDAGDGRLLLVTSDRISAFDVVMAEPDPRQGPGAHRHVGVLVRAARRRRRPATWSRPTWPTCPTAAAATRSWPAG